MGYKKSAANMGRRRRFFPLEHGLDLGASHECGWIWSSLDGCLATEVV